MLHPILTVRVWAVDGRVYTEHHFRLGNVHYKIELATRGRSTEHAFGFSWIPAQKHEEQRLAELAFEAAAALEMVERGNSTGAVTKLRGAILRSQSGGRVDLHSVHARNCGPWRELDTSPAHPPLSPTRTHQIQKGLVSNGVL